MFTTDIKNYALVFTDIKLTTSKTGKTAGLAARKAAIKTCLLWLCCLFTVILCWPRVSHRVPPEF